MSPQFRNGAAVFAVAAILAQTGLVSLSDLREYVAWPANTLALSVVAYLCGALLALAATGAVRLYLIGSVLGVILFGGFWAYASWALLGEQIPFVELIFSDPVFLYTIQRGLLLLAPSLVFGLMGVLSVQLFLPATLRP